MKIGPELVDAGKRASDIINELIAHHGWFNIKHKWIAIRLADGSYDGTLYDTRQDAVKHQVSEFHCMYLTIRHMGQGVRPMEMARVLYYHRSAYDGGFRLPDPQHPSGGPELLMPAAAYDEITALVSRELERIRNGR